MPLLMPDLSSWGQFAGGGGGVVVSGTPSYWNAGGRGDRTSLITVTTTATLGGGSISNLVNGDQSSTFTGSTSFTNGQTLREIKFDFGTAKVINGFRWLQSATTTHGVWVLEGSTDDSTYTGIGSSFTLGGIFSQYNFTNSSAYRYHRLRQTSGSTSSTPFLTEIEFSIAGSTDGTRDSLEVGDRTSAITVTTTASLTDSTTIDNLVDGDLSVSSTGAARFLASQTTREIKFDLGTAKIITEFLWLQSTSSTSLAQATASHGTWVWEGSNDDSTYTGIGSSFTLGGALIQSVARANTNAYRYYKLRQTSGVTSNNPWVLAVEFNVT